MTFDVPHRICMASDRLFEQRPGRVSGRHAPHMIVTSRLQDSYLQAQVEISSRLAHEYADCRSEFVATLSRYLPAVPSMDKLIMLRYGQPWIHGIDLAGPLGNNILELLFRVSVEHGNAARVHCRRAFLNVCA